MKRKQNEDKHTRSTENIRYTHIPLDLFLSYSHRHRGTVPFVLLRQIGSTEAEGAEALITAEAEVATEADFVLDYNGVRGFVLRH